MERPQLTEIEQIWLDKVKAHIKKDNEKEDIKTFSQIKPYDYVCSWWLRLEEEDNGNVIKTSKINYILSKVAKKGYLRKETNKSWTRFYLTKEEN